MNEAMILSTLTRKKSLTYSMSYLQTEMAMLHIFETRGQIIQLALSIADSGNEARSTYTGNEASNVKEGDRGQPKYFDTRMAVV